MLSVAGGVMMGCWCRVGGWVTGVCLEVEGKGFD